MRKNLPVTAIEYEMQEGRHIVSMTDLKGKITYVNPYFLEVSGYSAEELLGKPHNMIRHPDVPPEAFEDLWQTIKLGQPWTGLVKNRRKNGDFYWVVANVTPVVANGRISGYMSVRTKPSRTQIDAAGQLYRAMLDGNKDRISIRAGQVVPGGIAGWLARARNLPSTTRLLISQSIVTGALCATGAIALAASSGRLATAAAVVAAAGIAASAACYRQTRVALLRPMTGALQAARTMAGGDLAGAIDTSRHDEAGHLLHALYQMKVNLAAMLGDVRANIASVSSSTREIAEANMDFSSRTEMQASNLQETAASMEQLSSTVKQNADHAEEANRLVASASEVAFKGNEVVDRVGVTMREISASARKIVDITGIIDDIAFQTNILSLNAAVEAARAGEQGRGFAVVASEVRRLAQRSATAAKEIKALIEESANRVDAGNSLVAEASQTMTDIVGAVQRVSSIMDDITTASREQSIGIGQVNSAISEMDNTTQQNAAMVEQAAAVAASLDEQAEQLRRAVSIFKLDDAVLPVQGAIAAPQAAIHTLSTHRALRDIVPEVAPRIGHGGKAATAQDHQASSRLRAGQPRRISA